MFRFLGVVCSLLLSATIISAQTLPPQPDNPWSTNAQQFGVEEDQAYERLNAGGGAFIDAFFVYRAVRNFLYPCRNIVAVGKVYGLNEGGHYELMYEDGGSVSTAEGADVWAACETLRANSQAISVSLAWDAVWGHYYLSPEDQQEAMDTLLEMYRDSRMSAFFVNDFYDN